MGQKYASTEMLLAFVDQGDEARFSRSLVTISILLSKHRAPVLSHASILAFRASCCISGISGGTKPITKYVCVFVCGSLSMYIFKSLCVSPPAHHTHTHTHIHTHTHTHKERRESKCISSIHLSIYLSIYKCNTYVYI